MQWFHAKDVACLKPEDGFVAFQRNYRFVCRICAVRGHPTASKRKLQRLPPLLERATSSPDRAASLCRVALSSWSS